MATDDDAESPELSMDAICRFSGHLAHELNNLLTPIIACGQMLREGVRKDDPLHFCAEQIADAGDRCLALSRKLQIIGSRRSGGHLLAPASLITEAVKTAAIPKDRPIDVREPFREQAGHMDWMVKIDMEQFIFLAAELLRNAADAMPEGGTIRIGLDARDSMAGGKDPAPHGWVVLTVQDEGTGMTPDTLARMYEPYFSTRGHERDKGLGLTLVYGIVRRAGGHLTCESTPGAGTVFQVALPRQLPGQASSAPTFG